MIVRREQPADHADSRAVQVSAFPAVDGENGTAEPIEAGLLDELRACDGWLPALSWVAESDGRIIGHGICTRGHVGQVPCVGLGPIGVTPDRQRNGVGSALVQAMIGAADATGEPLIALLGSPDYYARFGFVASSEYGIEPPQAEWGDYFQVRTLSTWTPSIVGRFRYADPFENLD